MSASGIRSAGPAGGNEARAGYRWQSEPGWVRYGGAPLRAPRQICFAICLAASRGSTNAGGEDFGYFAHNRTDFACSPACLFRLPDAAMRLGMAVVKMSVTSVRAPSACRFGGRGFNSRLAFHAPVAQSLLFGAATASPVPRQPVHDPW